MGRDRRKRDRRPTADVDSANNGIEINTTTDAHTPLGARGQREPRNRSGQENIEVAVKKLIPVTEKPAAENLSEKKEETKEVPPDPAVLFANLKRETDDIKALTEKKFAKRQIFSNWSRYDEPLRDPVQDQEEEELLGADFNALCANLTTESNYFQLKSERSWDTNISALSSELFSLNADFLAASLGSIPFYERLDLPIALFSEADVQKMKSRAKSCKGQYESSKSYLQKQIDILRERSNAEDDLPLKAEREKTPDHKPSLSFSIDRPETPDELERNILPEVCEQVHSMPPRATRFSADIARKGSPEIFCEFTSKIPETNMTPQDFRTNRLNPKKQELNLQNFKESAARPSAEISFNTLSQREEINAPPKQIVEGRTSPKLVDNDEPSGKEVFEEINADIPRNLNLTLQRQTVSPETEKIKHFDNEANDAGSEMSSNVIQSESVPEKAVEESIPYPVPETLPARQINKNKSKEKKKRHPPTMPTTSGTAADSEAASPLRESELKSEPETVSDVAVNEDMKPQEEVLKPPSFGESLGPTSIPEPVPETLPPRQMNKNTSKEKKKQHNLKMPTTSGTAADSEVASPQRESELKSETETESNVALNGNMRYQEEVQKPLPFAESLSQRSKKRRSKEKGQYANKLVENSKMPAQEKPEITNALAKKTMKPVAQEIAVEKAKSPSPEKPLLKPHSTPQTKATEIVKSKQEKVSEPVKVVQEKSVEKINLKEDKPVQKVKSKEEKPMWKVKPREEKVKAPVQEKAVVKIKHNDDDDDDDDLDFLLGLREPVREPEVTPETSTEVSKPSIEKDNTSAKPTGLIFPEQAQELEDWLDSVLGD